MLVHCLQHIINGRIPTAQEFGIRTTNPGMTGLAPKMDQISPQMGHIWDFFKIRFLVLKHHPNPVTNNKKIKIASW